MILTDKKGNILAIAKGDNHNVNPTERIIDVLSHAKDKTIDIAHNHPSGSSFSFSDIQTLNTNTSIRTLSAIGHNGRKYYLTIPKGREVEKNILQKVYNDCYSESIQKSKTRVEKSDLLDYIQRTTIQLLANKLNWKYKEG